MFRAATWGSRRSASTSWIGTQTFEPALRFVLVEGCRDLRFELAFVIGAPLVGGEARIVSQLRPAEHVAELPEECVVAYRHDHVPVARREGVEG